MGMSLRFDYPAAPGARGSDGAAARGKPVMI